MMKMPERNSQLNQDESKLEFFIHNFWLPEWHNAKIKMYVNHFENIDDFIKKTLKTELDEDLKDVTRYFLILEIIVSTMFIAESLAAIAGACFTNPKNIQEYLKKFKATDFYENINPKIDDDYCAKLLAIPELRIVKGSEKKEIMRSIKDFREELNEIKKYYFSHLDLFNSYKHGFRIFPIQSWDEENIPTNLILYFSQKHKKDTVTIRRMEKGYQTHQELAQSMLYFIRVLLGNHKARLENPDKWEITIPLRKA